LLPEIVDETEVGAVEHITEELFETIEALNPLLSSSPLIGTPERKVRFHSVMSLNFLIIVTSI